MGILDIFRSKATEPDFAIKPPTQTPVPIGQWSLVVDAQGHEIKNRPPAAGDYLARPAVPYYDGGTIPVYTADPQKKLHENAQAFLEYECRSERNKALLKDAVFLLSQTDDGRSLLQTAHLKKFTLVFDHAQVTDRGATGLCDYANNRIPLAEGRSVQAVALTLKHELQHMKDIQAGLVSHPNDILKSMIAIDRALEGNARVSEAVAAAELYLGSPNGPPQQFKTASLMAELWKKNPSLASAATMSLDQARKGEWTTFATKTLPAYYANNKLIERYDLDLVKTLSDRVPDIRRDINLPANTPYHEKQASQQRIAHAQSVVAPLLTRDIDYRPLLKTALTVCGTPYITDKNGFDPLSNQALTLSPSAHLLRDHLKEKLSVTGDSKELGLQTPESAIAVLPAVVTLPFPSIFTNNTPPPFSPIVMPDNITGAMTNRGREHELTTTDFLAALSKLPSSRSLTDNIQQVIRNNLHSSTQNYRGTISALIDSGLRAPLGAFPQNYIADLYSRLYIASRSSSTGEKSTISRQEVHLLSHWQSIADHGLDPALIDKENRQKSPLGASVANSVYATNILKTLRPPETISQGPQARLQT